MNRLNQTYRLLISGGLVLLLSWCLSAQTENTLSSPLSGVLNGFSYQHVQPPAPRPVRAEDVLWKRDVYRIIDLAKGRNALLYYPVQASKDKKNLFSTLFEAIAQNKLVAYDYIDGREVFTPEYALNFKEFLRRFDIPYVEKTDPRKPGVTQYDIDAVDIPTAEVTLYYLKEVTFLNQRTSTVETKPIALCPVLIRTDENEGTRRFPMCWIPFDQLNALLSEQPIAADSLNSAERLTLYDFFNERLYEGDIYKVSNLKNQTIYDYCKTPEAIKAEQEKLEASLKKADEALWEPHEQAEAPLKKSKK
jgi:gliding motility associated protien GldN